MKYCVFVCLLIGVVISLPEPALLGGQNQNASSVKLTDLQIGQRISVQGRYLSQGIFLAEKVLLKDTSGHTILKGPIQVIDSVEKTLQVLGLNIILSEPTRISNREGELTSLTEMRVDDWVMVKGHLTAKETVSASEVQNIEPLPENTAEIASEIQRLSLGEWDACLLSDIPVVFDESLEIVAFGESSRLAASIDINRDDDDQNPAPLRIGNFLIFGGKAEIELEPQGNLDLNSNENELKSQFAIKPEIAVKFFQQLKGYAKLKLKRKPLFQFDNKNTGSSTELQASELYVTWQRLFNSSWQLRLGRQKFKDKREWLFDENLDAVRLIYDTKRLDMQLAVVEGDFFPQDDREDEVNQLYFIATARVKYARRSYLRGFLLRRQHHYRTEKLNWLGFMIRGQFSPSFRYWGNFAALSGAAAGKTLRSFAFDLGTTFSTASRKPVTLTLGLALASGDPKSRDGIDSRFRQTGLQGNSTKMHGLKRIRSYGEVFEPELSNIVVSTIGMGLRTTMKSSLELIFHTFHQQFAQPFLRDSNLDAQPLGIKPFLGKELDFIYTLREIRNLDIILNLGYFRSGSAFGNAHANVFLGKLKMQIYY